MRILSPTDLKERKGIDFSRQHRDKLIARGLFPKPIKLSDKPGANNYWLESEVDQYLQDMAAKRDAGKAA